MPRIRTFAISSCSTSTFTATPVVAAARVTRRDGLPSSPRTSRSWRARGPRHDRARAAARTLALIRGRLEPPARGIERDGLERLGHHRIAAPIRAGDDPALPLEPVGLEGAEDHVAYRFTTAMAAV